MVNTKVVLGAIGAIVIAFVGYKLLGKNYEPISIGDEIFLHVDMKENNQVENHFFTPNGTDVAKADKFIQITKYDHPDLTPRHVAQIQTQVIRAFKLRPVEGQGDRYFGVFRGSLPVYAYKGETAFVIHAGPEEAEPDKAALLAGANGLIDGLADIRTDF